MRIKKLLAIILALVIILNTFIATSLIAMAASTDQMIVFDQTGNSSSTSNILLPLNLPFGGTFRLTFKMRILSGSGLPIIGSLGTTGKGFTFTEKGHVNNSTTPAGGLYTSYDAESYTFTAVFKIDRYGATTTGGANCFITIGNAEHDAKSFDSKNYNLSFAMAEPELYMLDSNGNPTGSNLCPPINANTTNLNSAYSYQDQASSGWSTSAKPNIWATDTNTLRTFASSIPQGYFTAGYSYSAPEITEEDKMIFIKPTAEEYQVSAVAMPMYLPVNGTYRISIAAKTFNDAPVIGFFRATSSGLLRRDTDSDASKGGIMNYDAETKRYYWDYSFGYKSNSVKSGYGATGANVVITIGNYSLSKGPTGTYDASFMFAAPEVVKLVNGNVASGNLIPPITDETLNLDNCFNTSGDDAITSADIINAPFGKWSRMASNRGVKRAYAYDIPDGYFSAEYTATPHMLQLINPSKYYINGYETSLVPNTTYKLEYDCRAFNGAKPSVLVQSKKTGSSYSSITLASSTVENNHYTKTFTMPADSEKSSENFRFVIGIDSEKATDSTSVYFANFKLCRVTDGVDGQNLLPNGDFSFGSGKVTGEGLDSGPLATFNKYSGTNFAQNVIDIPEGFFTNELDVDNRMFCLEGGSYTKADVAFNLEPSTDYLFKYKYRSVGDEGYITMTQVLDDKSKPSLQYTETDDAETYTKLINFTTASNLAAKNNIKVLFCTGANSADKKFYISGLELYKLQNGEIVSENIIAGLNPILGDTGDVSLDEWGNVNSANGYGFAVYAADDVVEGKLSVMDVPADFFNYFAPAERLDMLRKVILGLAKSDGINPYYDSNNDKITDIRDLVKTNRYSSESVNEGGADAEASQLRTAIIDSVDAITKTDNVYYVDSVNGNDSLFNDGKSEQNAKKTLAGLTNIKSGDTVLLKRGGVYRVDGSALGFVLKEGVTYGAYGTGAKPVISGSVYNYAVDRTWTQVSTNIWKTDVRTEESGEVNTSDMVGCVYLIDANGDMTVGRMALTQADLTAKGDFFYARESSDGFVYIYSEGNPKDLYTDIEIAQHKDVVRLASNVTVDNIKVAFGGMHGMNGSKLTNVKITNCEVAYIGGAWLTTSRAGNGIQIGLGAKDITVTNNYIHDCYDAGLTFQTWKTNADTIDYKNLTFNSNLLEGSWYNFEFFTTPGDYLDNIDISNNIMRMAGYGCFDITHRQGYEESNIYMGANIRCGKDYYYPNTTNFTITNNIFDCSAQSLIYWNWNNVENSNEAHPGLTLSGNSYYQKAGATDFRVMYFGKTSNYAYASSQYGLEAAVSAMEASPKAVEWICEMR